MTPGDRAALEALGIRLHHVKATATLLAESIDRAPEGDVAGGIAATLDELAARIDLLTAARPA